MGVGLLSGKYSKYTESTLDSDLGVTPTMFKNLIGKNHPEFSTKQQQDAQEFFLHLINVLDRSSRHHTNPADALKFSVEDRVECTASGKVKYTYRDEWCLPLPIPLYMATNVAEVEEYEKCLEEAKKRGEPLNPDEKVRPKIALSKCIEKFLQSELVEQFFSTAVQAKTNALKSTRLKTMPDFLLLHLKKFTLRDDWVPMKLDVSVDVPDSLNIESILRATGLKPGEEELPDLDQSAAAPQFDPTVMQQLKDMGFPEEACKRAIFFTQNSGIESSTQWIMEHIGDPDVCDPFVPPSKTSKFIADPNGIEMIMGMGFNHAQATKALQETQNNVERAIDWIFSHQAEMNNLEDGMLAENPPVVEPQCRDGPGSQL